MYRFLSSLSIPKHQPFGGIGTIHSTFLIAWLTKTLESQIPECLPLGFWRRRPREIQGDWIFQPKWIFTRKKTTWVLLANQNLWLFQENYHLLYWYIPATRLLVESNRRIVVALSPCPWEHPTPEAHPVDVMAKMQEVPSLWHLVNQPKVKSKK